MTLRERLERTVRRWTIVVFAGVVVILCSSPLIDGAPAVAIGVMLVGAVVSFVGGYHILSIECPSCGYELGNYWVSRIGNYCPNCGVDFRKDEPQAGQSSNTV